MQSVEFDDRLIDAEAGTGLGMDLGHLAVALGAQDVLHLHGLDDRQFLAGLDLLALDVTKSETSSPGMGESRNRDRSGGSLIGMSAASSAARGVSTRASIAAPRWLRRRRGPMRSTCTVSGRPVDPATDHGGPAIRVSTGPQEPW